MTQVTRHCDDRHGSRREFDKIFKVDQVWFLDLILLRGREVPETQTARTEEVNGNSRGGVIEAAYNFNTPRRR